MNDSVSYSVVLSGNIKPGSEPESVTDAFSRLFKLPLEKARSVVGTKFVIKKGIDLKLAKTYKDKLSAIGLEVVLQKHGGNTLALDPIESVAPKPGEPSAKEMICPKCGLQQPKAEECSGCGVFVHKVTQSQVTQPSTHGNAAASFTPGNAGANVSRAEDPVYDEMDEGFFFTTSTLKLTVMAICSLGIYQLYWFYKNWILIKERTGQNIMPFWRAIFSVFWAYSCFKHIKSSAKENQLEVPEASFPIGMLAGAYFILQVGPSSDSYWLLSLFSFVLLIPANSVALRVNKHLDPDFANNERLSGLNWAGLVIGGLLLVLLLLGTFLIPEEQTEEFVFRKTMEYQLKDDCGEDRNCISAVEKQMESCLARSDWRRYLKNNEDEEELNRFIKIFFPCFKNPNGNSYF